MNELGKLDDDKIDSFINHGLVISFENLKENRKEFLSLFLSYCVFLGIGWRDSDYKDNMRKATNVISVIEEKITMLMYSNNSLSWFSKGSTYHSSEYTIYKLKEKDRDFMLSKISKEFMVGL